MYNKKLIPAAVLALLMFFATGIFAQTRVLDVSQPSVSRGTVQACTNGEEPIFNQPPNQSNGIFSDADCGNCGTGAQALAEDFILATEETISEITIFAGYFPDDQIPNPLDDWTITFHSDVAGLPGAVVSAAQTVSPTGTVTGVSLFGASEIQLDFTLPTAVTLSPGTYWIEMTSNSVGNSDSIFWEAGDLDPVAGRFNAVFATEVPGASWLPLNPTDDLAITMCGPLPLPESQPVPAFSKTGLIIMALMLVLLAGATVRRFS